MPTTDGEGLDRGCIWWQVLIKKSFFHINQPLKRGTRGAKWSSLVVCAAKKIFARGNV